MLEGSKENRQEVKSSSLFIEKRRKTLQRAEAVGDFTIKDREYIEELEKPILHILNQLVNKIKKGTYKLIIGEDASGRIPTLIIAYALKAIYEKQGFQPSIVRFIAGSSNLPISLREQKVVDVTRQIEKIKTTVKKRHQTSGETLIVTDTIHSGDSIKVFVNALKKNRMKFQIATIGITSLQTFHELQGQGISIVKGQDYTPDIWGMHALHGVKKVPRGLFARPYRYGSLPEDVPQASLPIAARAVAQEVADRIIAKYLENHK